MSRTSKNTGLGKTGIHFRFLEIPRALLSTRRGEGGLGIFVNLFTIGLLGAFGLILYMYAIPATIVLLDGIKESFFTLNETMSFYLKYYFFDGWKYIETLKSKDYLITIITAVYFGLWAVIVLYAFYNAHSSYKKNFFGGAATSRHGNKKATVEVNQLALAATTRTWNPNKTLEHAGLVIGYSPLLHRYYLSGEQAHTQTLAPPDSGKTTRTVYPTIHAILASKDSGIIFDMKSELYDNTAEAARKSGKRIILIDYANWRRSDLYNSMTEITHIYMTRISMAKEELKKAAHYFAVGETAEGNASTMRARNLRIEAISKADALAKDLAMAIIPNRAGNDEFWRPSARSLLQAVTLLVATYTEEDYQGGKPEEAPCEPRRQQRTLKTVRHLLVLYGKQERRKVGDTVKEHVPLEDLFSMLDPEHPAVTAFAQSKNTQGVTLSGIVSTMMQTLDAVIDQESNMMSYDSEFSIEDIAKEPTIVYLNIPEESPAKFAYMPIFITQAYQAFVRIARENGGQMPVWVHFVAEEIGNTPEIYRLANMVGTGRGYGMRFHFILQNQFQWNKIYGDKEAKSFKSSINVTNYVKFNDLETAREVSQMIGRHTIDVASGSSSSKANGFFDGTSSISHRPEEAEYAPPEKLLSWNPLWGSFVRRSEFDKNSPLNRLVFHRKEVIVGLYPTTKPKYLPTFTVFGLRNRKNARLKAIREQERDLSSQRIVVPSWDALPQTASSSTREDDLFKPGAIDSKTKQLLQATYWELKAIPDAERVARLYFENEFAGQEANCETFIHEAVREAEKQLKRENAVAHRLMRNIEKSMGYEQPYSCDDPAFITQRTKVKKAWLTHYRETLTALVNKNKNRKVVA